MNSENFNGPAVIVDPYSSGAFYAPAFRNKGISVIAVQSAATPPDVYAASYRPEDFDEILVANHDLSPLLERLKELKPRCILPGCESGVELADKLAPLVIPNFSNVLEKATARRHKGDMAKAVFQAGLPIIAQICTNDFSVVKSWLGKENLLGQDLVIKPPKSASTDGVIRIKNGIGLDKTFSEMLGKHNRLGIINDQLIVQEYVTGIEYVVDTVSYKGKHSICNVCQYAKIDNGAYMAVYDHMKWLPPTIPIYQELADYAYGVLDAVGMRFGPAHIEIMYTSNGPRLIEIGARPHGGGHPRFCRIATEDSQIDRTVQCFTKNYILPDSFQLKKNMLVVFLISRQAGRVVNAEILDKFKSLKSYYFSIVHIRNGDWLEPTKDLFASLALGFVVLANVEYSELIADYQKIREIEQELVITQN